MNGLEKGTHPTEDKGWTKSKCSLAILNKRNMKKPQKLPTPKEASQTFHTDGYTD